MVEERTHTGTVASGVAAAGVGAPGGWRPGGWCGWMAVVIDPAVKRCLGQMAEGVQVVSAAHDGVVRAYTSHWVSQVSFAEPIVLASISPRHDTWPLLEASGRFAVSLLAGDQVTEGQYFSYPGRRFDRLLTEYLEEVSTPDSGADATSGASWWVVPGCIAWLGCEVVAVQSTVGETPVVPLDHHLVFARVVAVGEGRIGEPPLVYSSRQGWRVASTKARTAGASVRDELLARVEAARQADR